jgi:hypothetical protein
VTKASSVAKDSTSFVRIHAQLLVHKDVGYGHDIREGELAYGAKLLYEHFSGTFRATQTLHGLARLHWSKLDDSVPQRREGILVKAPSVSCGCIPNRSLRYVSALKANDCQ